jgi:hypothetical protein
MLELNEATESEWRARSEAMKRWTGEQRTGQREQRQTAKENEEQVKK